MLTLISSLVAITLPAVAPAEPTIDSAAELPVTPLFLQDEEEEVMNRWTGAITVGASLSNGNTDIQRASAAFDAVKRLEGERFTVGAAWNYSSERGAITQRRAGAKGQYDYFINEKSYLLGQVSAETDDIANVDLRWTAGVGYGYQFRDDEEWRLAGEVGVSYFNEEFAIANAMGETEFDFIAARLAYKAEWDYSEKWAFMQIAEAFPSLEDSKNVYTKLDTRVKATLTESMFAQLQWIWDWDNTPSPTNKRSDYLYLLTVGWTY